MLSQHRHLLRSVHVCSASAASVIQQQALRGSASVANASIQPDAPFTESMMAGKSSRQGLKLHKLEDDIGDFTQAVLARREIISENNPLSKGVKKLPATSDNFDVNNFYQSIYGANCENVVGYMPLPVGVIGPLELNGKSYYVPMATTEGALLASTNRGARAIAAAGGATAVVLKDGMTRSPVLEFPSAAAAADFAEGIETPESLEQMANDFSTTTSHGKLISVTPKVAGKFVYLRFKASTGDAMGMNMVGKGVNYIMENILASNDDAKLLSLSSNMCTDKKPSAMNWIEGRGKSVVCEINLTEEIVENILGTTIESLVRTHTIKNLVGSSLAGSIGGNNAHSSNIVSAVFLATGQDPAQNVESSNCILLMDVAKDGRSVHVSVTMPSIEVGTVGGGTSLSSQRACLEMLGVAGASRSNPGGNAKELAEIVATTVLAGELSLNAALSSNDLISAHMDLNRKSEPTPKQAQVPTPKLNFSQKRTSLSHNTPSTIQRKRQYASVRTGPFRVNPTSLFDKHQVCSTLEEYNSVAKIEHPYDESEQFAFPKLPVP